MINEENYERFNKLFDEYFSKSELDKRKDFCYDCQTDNLYVHMMAFKCSKCHKIILG